MKFVKVQDQNPITLNAGLSRSLKIGSQEFWITGLGLEIELAKTDGALPTTYQDFMYRALTSMSLMGGGRTYMDIGAPDLRILYWATRLRLQGRCKSPDMIDGAVTMRHRLEVLFGVNPILGADGLNFFDPTAAVKPDEDLTLKFGWAAAADTIGANRTIGAGAAVYVTYYGIIPERPEEQPRWYPQWQSTNYQPPQIYKNKGGISRLTTGFYYRRSTVMVLNGAAPSDNRNDGLGAAAVSEIGARTKDGRYGVDMRFVDFVQKSQHQFQLPDDNGAVPGAGLAPGVTVTTAVHNPGVGMIDWAQQADTSPAPEGMPIKADPLYGINLIGKSDGAISLGFTVDVAAATQIAQLHECYMPY